jgi:hypothetical protein
MISWARRIEMTKFLSLVSVMLLMAGSAYGGIEAPVKSHAGGRSWTFCGGIPGSENGICADADTDLDQYALTYGYRNHTVYFETTNASNTCEVYAGNRALADSNPDSFSGEGWLVSVPPLSSTNNIITLQDAPFFMLFIDCTLAGGRVDLTIESGD